MENGDLALRAEEFGNSLPTTGEVGQWRVIV